MSQPEQAPFAKESERTPPDPAASSPSDRFGNYIRVHKLGAGGMGEVWRAWDVRVGRWVALKLLKGTDENEIARFLQEAHIAARLSHPNVAAVYDAGEANGRQFIAMQFIDGTTAAKLPRGDRSMLAQVVRDAARGVAEAHRQGIVHRDIKPDNLMVAARPDGSWQVFVTDFGLARRAERVSGLSVSGAIIGTPTCMPPEQARGEKTDARADVYALGATLYDLLCGRPPFGGNDLIEILTQIQDADPVPPREIERSISPDLESIVLKCLEKSPSSRYPTADALADDLDRFLKGEPVDARPVSLGRRVKRSFWKRRLAVASVVIALGGAGLASAILVPRWRHERQQRREAERVLELWAGVASILSESEVLSRAGEGRRCHEALDRGIALCRASEGGGDLAQARYFAGKLRLVGRDPEAAMTEFDRALEINPALGEARIERGMIEAEAYLARILDACHRVFLSVGPRATIRLDSILQADPSLGLLADRASSDLRTATGTSSFFREADRKLGIALLAMARREWPDARQGLQALLDADPSFVRAAEALMRLSELEERHADAIRLADSIAGQHRGRLDPLRTIVVNSHWLVYKNPEDPAVPALRQKEMAAARDLVARGPGTAFDFQLLAMACSDLELHAEAIKALDEALRQQPDFLDALDARGSARLESGDALGALPDFDRVLSLDSNHYSTWYNRGSAKRKLGRPREAIEDFGRALAFVPDWDIALNSRGLCWADLHEQEKAIADYTAALAAAPDMAMAMTNRGLALYELDRIPEALRDFDKAVLARPRYFNAWWGRGEIRWKIHDNAGAESDLTRALELEPASKDCRFFRGLARVELGRPDDALADLEPLAAEGYHPDQTHFGIGNACLLKNNLPRAIEEFRAAVAANPTHLEALRNLGLALLQSFKFADARDVFDNVLAQDPASYESQAMRGFCRQMTKDWKGAESDYLKVLADAPADWEGRADATTKLKAVQKRLSKEK